MTTDAADPIGIVELVGVAARLEAAFDELFRALGRWATEDGDLADERRRFYATMSHRHAWHAELWRSRVPAIPIDPGPTEPIGAPVRPDQGWYDAVLADLAQRIDLVRARADPDLDPSTRWVADLTLATLR